MHKNITIDGVTYAPVTDDSTKRQIVVVEGRWNIVGDVTEHDDGSLTITDGAVIIYWGTTEGLGELARDGATDDTRLGPVPTCTVPAHAVLLRIDVESDL